MELYVTLFYVSKYPVNVLSHFSNLKNKKENRPKKTHKKTTNRTRTGENRKRTVQAEEKI